MTESIYSCSIVLIKLSLVELTGGKEQTLGDVAESMDMRWESSALATTRYKMATTDSSKTADKPCASVRAI